MKFCPCGTQNRYLDCCGGIILGKFPAKSPLQLMRSRYTAHVEEKWDYIKKSMKPPASLKYDVKMAKKTSDAKSTEWVRVEVLNSTIDQHESSKGFVEFKAYYRLNGIEHCIHEKSEFHLIDGYWYYTDGTNPES